MVIALPVFFISPLHKNNTFKAASQFHLSLSLLCLIYFSYLMSNWSYYCLIQKSSVALHGLHDQVQSPYPDSRYYPQSESNLPLKPSLITLLQASCFNVNSTPCILYIPWVFSLPFPGICCSNYFCMVQFCLYFKTYLKCHSNDTPLLNFSPCPPLLPLNYQDSYQYHFNLHLFIPRSNSSPQ